MTYPPEHTTDFDNDYYLRRAWMFGPIWIGEPDEEDIEDEWTPRQRAEYNYQIDLENGDYD